MTTRIDRFQGVLLGILLAIGAGVAWGFAAGWTLTTVNDLFFRSTPVYEQLVVYRHSTPLIQSSKRQTTNYRSLDGKPVSVDSSQIERGVSLTKPERPRGWFVRLPWRERIKTVSRTRSNAEIWYLVHDGNLQGHAYLVGYDQSTKLKIGSIGRHGFQTGTLPPQDQFLIDGPSYRRLRYFNIYNRDLDDLYLPTDEGIVQIDLDARTVKTVWKDAGPYSFAIWSGRDAVDKPSKARILVRTLDRVRVLDIDGNEREVFPLTAELRDADDFSWVPLPDGKALAWRGGWGDKELFWLDATGVVRHEQVHAEKTQDISATKRSILLSWTIPVPVGFVAAAAVAPLVEYSDAGSYWAGLAQALADLWPGLLMVTVIGIVLAWFCYRRQRKYGLPWTPVWTILVLLLGLPVFFGYLAHRAWPARLPCPNCGRPAPRDRPACFACGRDFPAPALKGTEVFA